MHYVGINGGGQLETARTLKPNFMVEKPGPEHAPPTEILFITGTFCLLCFGTLWTTDALHY